MSENESRLLLVLSGVPAGEDTSLVLIKLSITNTVNLLYFPTFVTLERKLILLKDL